MDINYSLRVWQLA